MKEHVKTKGFYLNNRYFIGKTQKTLRCEAPFNLSTNQRWLMAMAMSDAMAMADGLLPLTLDLRP